MVEEIVYQDKLLKIVLPKSAAVKGHLQIMPKRAVNKLSELSKEEAEHFFYTCSYSATLLFELMKAEGTNIIINEDQEVLTANVLARRSDDVLDFTWNPQKIDDSEMSSVMDGIKDVAFYINNKEIERSKPKKTEEEVKEEGKDPKKEKEEVEKRSPDLKVASKKEDYLIKQLRRLP